jgi:hypothetical protein
MYRFTMRGEATPQIVPAKNLAEAWEKLERRGYSRKAIEHWDRQAWRDEGA